MQSRRLLSRILSTVLLFVIVAAVIWLVVTNGYIELFPALLLGLVVFFGTSLMVVQYGLSREMDLLNKHYTGIFEFEGDINRRLQSLEGENSTRLASQASEMGEHLARLANTQQATAERLSALERISGQTQESSSFETEPSQADSTKGTQKKKAPISRINIKKAIAGDDLSLHLQPVVALPQRQPAHYEALMRLQMQNGEFLDAGQFLKIAQKGGLMPTIDKKVVFSAVRMLRTLEVLKKRAGLFCNISSETLGDAKIFREISNILQANIALNHSLVFEISQRQYRHLNVREKDRLAKLADMGFVLSLDQVLDLRLDAKELFKAGFRYVKVPAGILLHASLDDNAPAAPSELASFLLENKISLIASEAERESEVMNLIDFGVQLSQGLIFAPPRPVKAELLLPTTQSANSSATNAPMEKSTSQISATA